jgi:acid phosphatase
MTVALAALAAAVPGEPSLGPKDIVPGKAFDRIVFIWLENTDYDIAAGDRNRPTFWLR